jgi:hypothetical protein
MNRASINCVLSMALLMGPGTAGLSRAADPTPPAKRDTVILHSLAPGEADVRRLGDSRQQLVDSIGELVAQEDVKRQLLKEIRQGFDGTAAMALKVHLVEQMVLEDQSRMLPLVSRAGERLRWDITRDMKHKEQLASERTTAVRKVEAQIDQLADAILALEEKGDGDEALALQRQLLQRKLQRNEAETKAREYADSAKSRQQELADIERLKKWIKASRNEAAIRNERLQDAIEHEHTSLLAGQVDAGRQNLRDTLSVLRARAEETEKAIVSSSQNPVRDGAPVTHAVRDAVQPAALTDEERTLIQEELSKARDRKSAATKSDPVTAEDPR